MIDFSDITLREAHGNHDRTCEIMLGEAPQWMLRSEVFVSTGNISCGYLIHFWYDGRAVIKATDHPIVVEAPDDDIRELSQFVRDQGWKPLEVSSEMLDDPGSFEFWLRLYQSGMIQNDLLQSHDENEMARLAAAYEMEQEEEDAY
jgi:hypothetical protein